MAAGTADKFIPEASSTFVSPHAADQRHTGNLVDQTACASHLALASVGSRRVCRCRVAAMCSASLGPATCLVLALGAALQALYGHIFKDGSHSKVQQQGESGRVVPGEHLGPLAANFTDVLPETLTRAAIKDAAEARHGQSGHSVCVCVS